MRQGIAQNRWLPNRAKGLEAKQLPTIIFPHGGPISYNSNDFDYWAQFFANRGYAVFRMNFRARQVTAMSL